MAENPTRGGGSAPRGRGRGGRGGFGGFVPANAGSLDPEHPSFLMDKWSKKLGKDLASIEVKYTATGVQVVMTGMAEGPFKDLQNGSIADYRRLQQAANAQTSEQKLRSLRNKFETRLGRDVRPEDEFPAEGTDEAIAAFVSRLPRADRLILAMSQKQYNTAHPNGSAA